MLLLATDRLPLGNGLYRTVYPYQTLGIGLAVVGLILFNVGIFRAPRKFLSKQGNDLEERITGDTITRYLFAVVVASSVVILAIGLVLLFYILVLYGFGRAERIAFGLAEAFPFLALALPLFLAGLGIHQLRMWAWWLGLLGSIAAAAYGIYRYYLSPPFVPWSTTGEQYPSSYGAVLLMILGVIVSAHLLGLLWFFRRRVTTKEEMAVLSASPLAGPEK